MKLNELIKDPSWQELLSNSFKKDSWQQLSQFLDKEFQNEVIFPKAEDIFTAFNLTSYHKTKIVILGQDPYHGPDQAHGLAFSVKSPCKPPPSLKNIFKELGIQSSHGDLSDWAKQGVFLLNTVLTVRSGNPHSHKNKGWEEFTDSVIRLFDARPEPVIFILWGAPAQSKIKLINADKHRILQAPHPSPLSAYRGFFGCDHFDEANRILNDWQQTPINWELHDDQPQQLLLF